MNKKQWLLVAVVVVVVALGYWMMGRGGKLGEVKSSPTPVASASPSAKPPVKAGASATPAAPAKSYTELVKEYEGRRIQFDQNCQAVPGSITYKSGTSIMLDNRSGDARNIKVGSDSYALAGYGYKIVTLSGSGLPKELLLSCGSAVNVGKILLQASLNQ
jgi:hypothetical protein